MNIGFALTGSFCTFSRAFRAMELLAERHRLIPIFSFAAATQDTRFGAAREHLARAEAICGRPPLLTLQEVEPLGPKALIDLLIIAPCTGSTLARLSLGLSDTPVTMAAKSHLRGNGPVLIALSTNDALTGSAENIGRLLNRRNLYFVPFGQDDPVRKPAGLTADLSLLPQAAELALTGHRLQPQLLGPLNQAAEIP